MKKEEVRLEEDFEIGEIGFYSEFGDIYKVKIIEDLNKTSQTWKKITVAYKLKILEVQRGHTMREPYGKVGQEFDYIRGKGEYGQFLKNSLFSFLTHSFDTASHLANRFNGREIKET